MEQVENRLYMLENQIRNSNAARDSRNIRNNVSFVDLGFESFIINFIWINRQQFVAGGRLLVCLRLRHCSS